MLIFWPNPTFWITCIFRISSSNCAPCILSRCPSSIFISSCLFLSQLSLMSCLSLTTCFITQNIIFLSSFEIRPSGNSLFFSFLLLHLAFVWNLYCIGSCSIFWLHLSRYQPLTAMFSTHVSTARPMSKNEITKSAKFFKNPDFKTTGNGCYLTLMKECIREVFIQMSFK